MYEKEVEKNENQKLVIKDLKNIIKFNNKNFKKIENEYQKEVEILKNKLAKKRNRK